MDRLAYMLEQLDCIEITEENADEFLGAEPGTFAIDNGAGFTIMSKYMQAVLLFQASEEYFIKWVDAYKNKLGPYTTGMIWEAIKKVVERGEKRKSLIGSARSLSHAALPPAPGYDPNAKIIKEILDMFNLPSLPEAVATAINGYVIKSMNIDHDSTRLIKMTLQMDKIESPLYETHSRELICVGGLGGDLWVRAMNNSVENNDPAQHWSPWAISGRGL